MTVLHSARLKKKNRPRPRPRAWASDILWNKDSPSSSHPLAAVAALHRVPQTVMAPLKFYFDLRSMRSICISTGRHVGVHGNICGRSERRAALGVASATGSLPGQGWLQPAGSGDHSCSQGGSRSHQAPQGVPRHKVSFHHEIIL